MNTSNFFLLILLQSLVLFVSCKNRLEFFLSEFEPCNKNSATVIQPSFTHANITKNVLHIEGTAKITEQISDKFALLLQYKKAKFGTKEFTRVAEFPIPQPCLLMTAKTVFGDPIGNSFAPRFTCPLKAGTYKFNFTINLNKVADIPDVGYTYHTNFLMLDPTKDKVLLCRKTVVWMRRG